MSDLLQRQTPLPHQESVWDYPRPPRPEPTSRRIRVIFNGETLADTTRAVRVLETSHPPVYYIPPDDIQMAYFTATTKQSMCDFKGLARYWTIRIQGKVAENAAWSYPNPTPGYESIKNYLAFYAGGMDACYVDDERVIPQEGDFYGGWITSDIVGPFKGGPGTWLW
jgi:uncharacterized protein (DUF427 family)